jgi:hypothetical protein
MGRKSSIQRSEPKIRAAIERLLRENRMTLDEMLAVIRREFGPTSVPSRSALHRFKVSFEEMVSRMREIETAASVVVGELGEGVGDKAGQLLTQAITTLATSAALDAHEREVSIDDVRKLAVAARNAMEARRVSLRERQEIEKAARDRLVREQQEKLTSAEKAGRFDPETLRKIREEIYGISA